MSFRERFQRIFGPRKTDEFFERRTDPYEGESPMELQVQLFRALNAEESPEKKAEVRRLATGLRDKLNNEGSELREIQKTLCRETLADADEYLDKTE